jgi:hypothetical protein
MRMWLDFSIRLASEGTTLLGSAYSVIRQLREAGLEHTRTLDAQASPRTDVVWRHASPMEDYGTDWVPHRIIRRTPQTVLVEAHPAIAVGATDKQAPGSKQRVRTYWLSRRDIERLGVARVRTRTTVFFSRPNASDKTVRTINSLIRLGIWFPFDEADLRQAYLRHATQLHPDAGGTDEKFIQLQDDLERAKVVLDLPVNTPGN